MFRCRWTQRGRSKKLATAWLFARTGGWTRAEFHCGGCKARKLYEHRNCPKFFPELVQIRRGAVWAPVVSAKGRTPEAIPGYRLTECPTSYITAESLWIIEQAEANALAKRECGTSLFGSDAGKYPAWWLDALAAIARARNDYDVAESKMRD